MTQLDAIWDQLFPAEQTRIVKLLVEKVIVSPTDLEVRLRANGIERVVLELQPAMRAIAGRGGGMSDTSIQKAGETAVDRRQRWAGDPVGADPDQAPQRAQAGDAAERRRR